MVREDAQLLSGFAMRPSANCFDFCQNQRRRTQLALAISSLDPCDVVDYENNEVSVLTKVPGVGKKTAERLMVELKSSCKACCQQDWLISKASLGTTQQAAWSEGADALVALGYKPLQAQQMISQCSNPMNCLNRLRPSNWYRPLGAMLRAEVLTHEY